MGGVGGAGGGRVRLFGRQRQSERPPVARRIDLDQNALPRPIGILVHARTETRAPVELAELAHETASRTASKSKIRSTQPNGGRSFGSTRSLSWAMKRKRPARNSVRS